MPKGYIYAEFEVINVEQREKYVPLARAAIAASGARYVVVAGDPEVVEGELGRRRPRLRGS